MNFLANLLSAILWNLLERFGLEVKKAKQDNQTVEEEGARAEEAAKDAVSELQKPEPETPAETPTPKAKAEVPSVKKWEDFFKHRRNRKR